MRITHFSLSVWSIGGYVTFSWFPSTIQDGLSMAGSSAVHLHIPSQLSPPVQSMWASALLVQEGILFLLSFVHVNLSMTQFFNKFQEKSASFFKLQGFCPLYGYREMVQSPYIVLWVKVPLLSLLTLSTHELSTQTPRSENLTDHTLGALLSVPADLPISY